MKIGLTSAGVLRDRIKLVLDKEVSVANDRGFIMAGKDKGDLSLAAYKAINDDNKAKDAEKNLIWKSINYEGNSIGAYAVKDDMLSEEILNVVSGMAEVILYQYFLLKKLYSVTDLRADFIKDLLASERFSSLDDVITEADILKINLRANQAVIIVSIENLVEDYANGLNEYSDEEKRVRILAYVQNVEATIKKAFNDFDQNVIVYADDDKFIILKGVGEDYSSRNIETYLREKAKYIHDVLRTDLKEKRLTIGVGQYYPGLKGLRKSYQDALIALEVGLKVWGPDRIYHILDVGTFVALSGDIPHKRKIEISEQVLGQLLSNEELLKTVKAFLSSGMNLTEASKELHLHRNTLIYRLNKVKELIGLDPKKFSDALKIKLGLLVCQIK